MTTQKLLYSLSTPGEVTRKVFTGLDGLCKIKADWGHVYQQIYRPRYYHHWDWMESYIQYLVDDPDSIQFIVFRSRGEPTTILPLQYLKNWRCCIPLSSLRLPYHKHLNISDFVCSSDAINEIYIEEIFHYLTSDRLLPRHSLLQMRNVPSVSPLADIMKKMASSYMALARQKRSAYFDCTNENALNCALPGRLKRNLRRIANKVTNREKLISEFVCDMDDLPKAYNIFVFLESSGWKGNSGSRTAIGNNFRLRQFYQSLITSFGERERCQINLLKMGNKYVAGQFCLKQGRRLYILKIGYDESYKYIAPGALLLMEVLKNSAKDKTIDAVSLTTAPEWANRWNPNLEDLEDIYLFSKSVTGIIGRAGMSAWMNLKNK